MGTAAANICVEKRHWWSAVTPPLTVEGMATVSWASLLRSYRATLGGGVVAVEAVHHLNTARDLSIKFAEQNEAALTAMTKKLAEEDEAFQTELTAISKGANCRADRRYTSSADALGDNTEARITAI